MNVLVDTSIWSLALRREQARGVEAGELAVLIEEGRVTIIGPVRQEILSGVKGRPQFERLRDRLRAFPDVALTGEDYEEAASCFNRCRARGVQGANTDFLICAVAIRLRVPIFSTDVDFRRFARVLPIALHEIRR